MREWLGGLIPSNAHTKCGDIKMEERNLPSSESLSTVIPLALERLLFGMSSFVSLNVLDAPSRDISIGGK